MDARSWPDLRSRRVVRTFEWEGTMTIATRPKTGGARIVMTGEPRPLGSWMRRRLSTSRVPMFVVDRASGAIVATNDAGATMHGVDAASELAGHSIDELFAEPPPTLEDSAWRSFRMRERTGAVYVGEVTTVSADDDDVVLLVRPALRMHSRTLFPRPRAYARDEDELRPTPALPRVQADPRVFVRLVVARTRPLATEKHVAVVVRVECGDVWVRPDAWLAALYELVRNAVEASGTGDPVFLDVVDLGDGETLWQVQDTGRGMSKQAVSALGAGGNGGLDLVRAVVQVHDGLLRIDSALQAGTTVSVLLPRGEVT